MKQGAVLYLFPDFYRDRDEVEKLFARRLSQLEPGCQ